MFYFSYHLSNCHGAHWCDTKSIISAFKIVLEAWPAAGQQGDDEIWAELGRGGAGWGRETPTDARRQSLAATLPIPWNSQWGGEKKPPMVLTVFWDKRLCCKRKGNTGLQVKFSSFPKSLDRSDFRLTKITPRVHSAWPSWAPKLPHGSIWMLI